MKRSLLSCVGIGLGRRMRFFSALFLLVFSLGRLSAQSDTGWVNPEHTRENLMGLKQGWFVGADFGTTLFYGDVALYNNFPKFKDFKRSFSNEYSFWGGKKLKWGLAAEAQVFKGKLYGEKEADRLYHRKFYADMMGYQVNAKYNLTQAIFRERNQTRLSNRLTVFVTVGVGQVFFRSRLYKQAYNGNYYLEKTTGYKNTGIDSAGVNSAGGLVTDKSGMASAIILPVGGKIHYKLNKRTDIVADIIYTTVFSDQVDSWSRSWSHKDRYLYAGLGLCYNFGRSDADEVPDNERYHPPAKKAGDAYVPAAGGAESTAVPSSEPRSSGKKAKNNSANDKDLEIKLKLYELQLKLFEMQYLLTN